MSIKIQDEQGKDLFVIEDQDKEPRQVAEVKKKELDSELDEEEEENTDA